MMKLPYTLTPILLIGGVFSTCGFIVALVWIKVLF